MCCILIMQAGMIRLRLCLVFGSLLRTDEGACQWDIFANASDGKNPPKNISFCEEKKEKV